MNTVIFKWNPAFSSQTMYSYLSEIIRGNYEGKMEGNWSAWEWQSMMPGDRWYMVKVGCGATGIVGCGTLKGRPYRGKDWSGKGREVYYVDMKTEMMLNPDALPILTSQTLTDRIPEFDWDRGHSGAVLPPDVAERLNRLWDAFVDENRELFIEKAELPTQYNDRIFWKRSKK